MTDEFIKSLSEEFKVSDVEKFSFIITTGNYPLIIGHSIDKPFKDPDTLVQITNKCIPKLKEFINSKYGEKAFGRPAGPPDYVPPYYVDECKDDNFYTLYHFKRTLDESSQETEAITIYWIGVPGATDETISHVEIGAIAIHALRKFINKYF